MSYFLDIPRVLVEDLLMIISDILSNTHEYEGKRFLSDCEIMELKKMKDNFENLLYEQQVEFARWINQKAKIDNRVTENL